MSMTTTLFFRSAMLGPGPLSQPSGMMGGIVSPTANGASGDGATAVGPQPLVLATHAKIRRVNEQVCFTVILIHSCWVESSGQETEYIYSLD